jgi:hypothetical protein
MKNIAPEELKSVLSKVIPSVYPYWVMLSNGTFIVLETEIASTRKDLKKWVNELLSEFERYKLTVFAFIEDIVHIGGIGWIVTNRYGAYTFVHSSEFNEAEPSELAISVKGCLNFFRDCTEKEIIHIEAPLH